MRTSQKGFSAVIVLLSIITIAVVGFVGYYVYDKQSNKTVANTNNESIQQGITTDGIKNPESAEEEFRVFGEFGVKAPRDTNIDKKYKITYYDSEWEHGHYKVNNSEYIDELKKAGATEDILKSCSSFNSGKIIKIDKSVTEANDNLHWMNNSIALDSAVVRGEAIDLGDFYVIRFGPDQGCEFNYPGITPGGSADLDEYIQTLELI